MYCVHAGTSTRRIQSAVLEPSDLVSSGNFISIQSVTSAGTSCWVLGNDISTPYERTCSSFYICIHASVGTVPTFMWVMYTCGPSTYLTIASLMICNVAVNCLRPDNTHALSNALCILYSTAGLPKSVTLLQGNVWPPQIDAGLQKK